MISKKKLESLGHALDGEFHVDNLSLSLYSTDASVYRRKPLAVALPKNKEDIKKIIQFADAHEIGLIPRTAGTSLAGQCVGEGIIVDVSKYFTKTFEFNEEDRTIWVEPGVIRDDLNRFLKPYGLFFGPNTATSNRCMIGGMVGNNSSGTTSIKYGVTRDKVLEMEVFLADGSLVTFSPFGKSDLAKNTSDENVKTRLVKKLHDELNHEQVWERVLLEFPKREIHRRNTGYALDSLVRTNLYLEDEPGDFNVCHLLAGSEGTLAFTTKIKLQLDTLPPPYAMMIAAHFHSIKDCLNAVEPLMEHDLFACEMMDKTILDCTKNNLEQERNRAFIYQDPEAILMMEIRADNEFNLRSQKNKLLDKLDLKTKSFASAVLYDEEMDQAKDLRKAGLGLLANLVGDKKAVACIEDTAVALSDLANFIDEFSNLMKTYDQSAVYYAHAGAGELHLRPILNLKKSEDLQQFKSITDDVATLVKRYQGSMSGEHGDGIVRASYIPQMIGAENYALLKRVKSIFDPKGIFNPGKIVDPYPMDEKLRYEVDRTEPDIDSFMKFDDTEGFLRAAEKCNGSGDCRKSVEAGGTMCPSYRVTKNEKDTTRGRANALREFITNNNKVNKFNHKELKEAFDLCLSCKACASECPSNVDVATLKAEFDYQYQLANGVSWRSKAFGNSHRLNVLGRKTLSLTNYLFTNDRSSSFIKKTLGIAPERSLPVLSKMSFREWWLKNRSKYVLRNPIKTVLLFIDEFSDQLDVEIAIDAVQLLYKLGYEVQVLKHKESGRALISKGLLPKAKAIANENLRIFEKEVSADKPLIGIEPSAILTLRDEYLRLCSDQQAAKNLAKNVFLIEEFLFDEMEHGSIEAKQFTKEEKSILVHGHCHQKALSDISKSYAILDLPVNYKVVSIPSGCCGMAGSFGYEKEHYELSMQVGEQTLFPAVRKAEDHKIIVANGTSCRQQIKDGTSKEALHTITILNRAIAKDDFS